MVGVPEICPLADKVKPEGRVPENSDQLYGAVPPAAARLWLYPADCVPLGREVVPTERSEVVPPLVLKTKSTQKFEALYLFAGKALVLANAYTPFAPPPPLAGACNGALSTPEVAK